MKRPLCKKVNVPRLGRFGAVRDPALTRAYSRVLAKTLNVPNVPARKLKNGSSHMLRNKKHNINKQTNYEHLFLYVGTFGMFGTFAGKGG